MCEERLQANLQFITTNDRFTTMIQRSRQIHYKCYYLNVIMTSLLFLFRTHAFRIGTVSQRMLGRSIVQRWQQQPNLQTLSQCWMSSSDDYGASNPLPMENLYQEWSLQEDEMLWDNRDKTPPELAFLLGRGIRGVQARLSKLQDVSTPAYERLFVGKSKNPKDDDVQKKTKLVPVSEVLRRIEWDYMLQASDFLILHYDRVDDKIMETPLDAPNDSIGGDETSFIKALPEHRIEGVKFKERIVWDRQDRLDLVFGDPGIYEIVETYDEWKKERDQVLEWNRQRQAIVAERIKTILGLDMYAQLQALSKELQNDADDANGAVELGNSKVESYIRNVLELFRLVRQDPTQSLEASLVPPNDYEALNELSELVAVLPDADLRSLLLTDISDRMDQMNPEKASSSSPRHSRELVALSEDDLTESFVRGSGPGGQKVNKTSNRVVLVHEPTQLRVECQETRSLQQNRKIARKRLLEKLDEYYNGRQSKVSMKQQKASQKRSKTKSKNRARLRKKQQAKEQSNQD